MNVTVLGAGTIGLSWARLFASHDHKVVVCDPRPDLKEVVDALPISDRVRANLTIVDNRAEAMSTADVIQESGPERLEFKKALIAEFATAAPSHALLFSSSSAIPSSKFVEDADDSVAARVAIGHPFNPPHLVPLVEFVPNPRTTQDTIDKGMEFYRGVHKEPVFIAKEVPGFVGNRLQKAMWNEAFGLVQDGIISATDLDSLVKNSLGMRWASVGVFEAAALGGGANGMAGIIDLLRESFAEIKLYDTDWSAEAMAPLYEQANAAYGAPARPELAKERDRRQAAILELRGQTDEAINS